jgi:DNA-binding NarL/FixJ family response regulator
LEKYATELQRKDIALSEVLGQLEIEKAKLASNVSVNVQKMLLPIVEKLIEKSSSLDSRYLLMIKQNLARLTSSTGVKLSSIEYQLTPKEIELCTLIKSGFSIKEIATMQNLSERTVETHRFNIRKKLGLTSSKINLSSYLAQL